MAASNRVGPAGNVLPGHVGPAFARGQGAGAHRALRPRPPAIARVVLPLPRALHSGLAGHGVPPRAPTNACSPLSRPGTSIVVPTGFWLRSRPGAHQLHACRPRVGERKVSAVSGAAVGAPEGAAVAVPIHLSKEHGTKQTTLEPRGDVAGSDVSQQHCRRCPCAIGKGRIRVFGPIIRAFAQ